MKKYVVLGVIALVVVYIASNMSYAQQSIVPLLQTVLVNEPFKEELSALEFTYWDRTVSIETTGYIHFVEFLIRKCTHFLGYGTIGVIFYVLYRKLKWSLPVLWAIASVFLIAVLDEYNQFHTSGRTGTFQDVKLDVAGAIFMIFLVKILLKVFRR